MDRVEIVGGILAEPLLFKQEPVFFKQEPSDREIVEICIEDIQSDYDEDENEQVNVYQQELDQTFNEVESNANGGSVVPKTKSKDVTLSYPNNIYQNKKSNKTKNSLKEQLQDIRREKLDENTSGGLIFSSLNTGTNSKNQIKTATCKNKQAEEKQVKSKSKVNGRIQEKESSNTEKPAVGVENSLLFMLLTNKKDDIKNMKKNQGNNEIITHPKENENSKTNLPKTSISNPSGSLLFSLLNSRKAGSSNNHLQKDQNTQVQTQPVSILSKQNEENVHKNLETTKKKTRKKTQDNEVFKTQSIVLKKKLISKNTSKRKERSRPGKTINKPVLEQVQSKSDYLLRSKEISNLVGTHVSNILEKNEQVILGLSNATNLKPVEEVVVLDSDEDTRENLNGRIDSGFLQEKESSHPPVGSLVETRSGTELLEKEKTRKQQVEGTKSQTKNEGSETNGYLKGFSGNNISQLKMVPMLTNNGLILALCAPNSDKRKISTGEKRDYQNPIQWENQINYMKRKKVNDTVKVEQIVLVSSSENSDDEYIRKSKKKRKLSNKRESGVKSGYKDISEKVINATFTLSNYPQGNENKNNIATTIRTENGDTLLLEHSKTNEKQVNKELNNCSNKEPNIEEVLSNNPQGNENKNNIATTIKTKNGDTLLLEHSKTKEKLVNKELNNCSNKEPNIEELLSNNPQGNDNKNNITTTIKTKNGDTLLLEHSKTKEKLVNKELDNCSNKEHNIEELLSDNPQGNENKNNIATTVKTKNGDTLLLEHSKTNERQVNKELNNCFNKEHNIEELLSNNSQANENKNNIATTIKTKNEDTLLLEHSKTNEKQVNKELNNCFNKGHNIKELLSNNPQGNENKNNIATTIKTKNGDTLLLEHSKTTEKQVNKGLNNCSNKEHNNEELLTNKKPKNIIVNTHDYNNQDDLRLGKSSSGQEEEANKVEGKEVIKSINKSSNGKEEVNKAEGKEVIKSINKSSNGKEEEVNQAEGKEVIKISNSEAKTKHQDLRGDKNLKMTENNVVDSSSTDGNTHDVLRQDEIINENQGEANRTEEHSDDDFWQDEWSNDNQEEMKRIHKKEIDRIQEKEIVKDSSDNATISDKSEKVARILSIRGTDKAVAFQWNHLIILQQPVHLANLNNHQVVYQQKNHEEIGETFQSGEKTKEKVALRCNNCSYQTISKSRLEQHITYRHTAVENMMDRMNKCDQCPKMYKALLCLKRHKLHVHGNRDRTTLYCAKCDFTTTYKAILMAHVKMHMYPDTVHNCPHCDFTTKNRRRHYSHIQRLHGKTLLCHVCSYTTKHTDKLRLHLITHKKVKEDADFKFRCDKCDYRAYRQYSLKIHKLNHLKPEEVEYFYCYHCDFKAKRKDNLKTHISRHFQRFQCVICEFTARTKGELVLHTDKHSKEQREEEDTQ